MSSGLNLDVTVLSQCLPVAQKLATKNALLKIALQEGRSLRFWGRIQGNNADYLIAVATDVAQAITKEFYWSNDSGATFSQLPAPDEFVSVKSPKIRGLFTGNPSLKYKDPDAAPKLNEDGEIESEDEEEEEEEEEEPIDEDEVDEDGNPMVRQPPPRRLTELERLSYNVREIESDTGIVPRGLYYITATGAILKNPAFTGLSLEDSRKLSSYVLLRNAQQASTLASVRKMGVANHHDFLDPVVAKGAKVKNTWSLQVSDSGLEISLRSLLYPGFEYQLEAGTNNYTGGYFGLGEKNGDILFML